MLGAFEILQWMYHTDKLHLRVALYSRSGVNHLTATVNVFARATRQTRDKRLFSVAESIVLSEIVTADNPYVRSV